MKERNLITAFFIIFCIFFIYYLYQTPEYNDSQIELSQYTEIDAINIENNADWSSLTSNDWCSGSGTWNDPYIIENVKIDGGKGAMVQNTISIQNSNMYFIIRNSIFINTRQSILLNSVSNGTIIKCSSNDIELQHGITGSSVFNITIRENTFVSSLATIILSSSSNNSVLSNQLTINEGSMWGIEISGDNNIIKDNIITSFPERCLNIDGVGNIVENNSCLVNFNFFIDQFLRIGIPIIGVISTGFLVFYFIRRDVIAKDIVMEWRATKTFVPLGIVAFLLSFLFFGGLIYIAIVYIPVIIGAILYDYWIARKKSE